MQKNILTIEESRKDEFIKDMAKWIAISIHEEMEEKK